MTLVATMAAFAMAAVLFRAASEKVRRPAALASTIERLGMPRSFALAAAWFVTAAELSVAVALLFRPDSRSTQLGVLVLAFLFAIAGLRALRIDEPVACNCFGAESGPLGLRQIVWFVPWAAGAVLLYFGAPRVPATTAAALFAAIALGVAAMRAIDVRTSMKEARDDRRSAEEMYRWLPSY